MSYYNPKKAGISLPWTGEQLYKRFDAAKKRKEQWVTLYREAMQYVTPQRETFYHHTPGEKKTRLLYDSTAQESADVFSSRIMSTITPSWQRWSEFRAGSDIPEDQAEEINKALAEVNKTVFQFINHSNFTSQANECYLDLVFGTGALLVERGEGEDLLEHTATPLSELFLEEGPNGKIETNYRCFKAPARVLGQQFPKANWSPTLTEAIQNKPDNTFSVVMCSVYEPKEKVYFQILLEDDEKHIAQYHIEESNPWIIPRWAVTAGEIYGRGPAIKKLPDIKTLNKMTEFTLRHAAMAVSGAYTAVDDGVINPYNIQIKPNAIIPVKASDSLQPLAMAGSPEYNQLVRNELVDGIKEAFLAFPMPSFDDPVRTATEMSIRNSELLKNAGAQLGRLKSEFIEPYIARVVDILKQEGKIPDLKLDGREISIKHTSPLAKIEDQEDLQGLATYFQHIMNVEQLSPGITALSTKLEEIPNYLALKIGGFEDLIRSPEEAKQLGEQVMAQGQAMIEEQQVE